MKRPLVVCLMGPTASGKTQCAIDLVRQFPMSIVSVDSAMVYREMDIGTAKPTQDVLDIAPHRLIDIRDPANPYSAADFCHDARREINDILAEGRIPLLVGGTMLYFRALQLGLSTLPEADADLRAMILAQAQEKGWEVLYEELKQVDPEAAARIHSNDPQRLQRAIEVYRLTGKPMSAFWHEEMKTDSVFTYLNLAIMPSDRALLHARIEKRFNEMLSAGFLDEVRRLYARGDLHRELPAIRSVGYRQLWAHLEGELTLEQARERAIVVTRQLAKRQMTWLRSWQDLHTIDPQNIVAFIKEQKL